MNSSAEIEEKYNLEEIFNLLNWGYIQEGNENIVLRYIGKDPKMFNIVMRVVKKGTKEQIQKDPNTINAFTELLVAPLLGSNYLPFKEFVKPPINFINKLDEYINNSRPKFRKDKKVDSNAPFIILSQNLLTMHNDVHTLNTLSVEIKPKWGFLPTSTYISKQNSIKLYKCRFCLHQTLKYEKKDKSLFCPMELYSNDINKVKNSLKALLKTPQNNFRIFLDGELVSVDKALEVILLRFEVAKEDSESTFISLISNIILQDGILTQLSKVQKILDQYDIEGINKIISKLQKEYLEEPNNQIWKNVVEYVMNNDTIISDVDELDEQQLKTIVYAFIASLSFKDCSLILTIPLSDNLDTNSTIANKLLKSINKDTFKDKSLQPWLRNMEKVYYQLGVVDLDPKSHLKLDKYFKLDQDIVKANMMGNI